MLALLHTLQRRLRGERGFTLVEVLIATVTSVVVLGAASEVLIVSLHQSARVSDYAQATQAGRATMNDIVDELRSACFGPTSSSRPIQEGSSATALIFVDAFSERAQIEPSEAQKHKIVWAKEGAKETLTDTTWVGSGGEWPNFTYPVTPTRTTIIGEHIAHSTEEKGAQVPIFQYYKYAPEATEPASGSATALEPLLAAPELTKTSAPEAASVLISFRALPTDNYEKLSRGVDLSSQVTLAFSAPIAEPKIGDSPCS